MTNLGNAVFSCGAEDNDIDQSDELVRADGEIVADTSFAGTRENSKYLATRIVLALNHVRGLTLGEIRALGRINGGDL